MGESATPSTWRTQFFIILRMLARRTMRMGKPVMGQYLYSFMFLLILVLMGAFLKNEQVPAKASYRSAIPATSPFSLGKTVLMAPCGGDSDPAGDVAALAPSVVDILDDWGLPASVTCLSSEKELLQWARSKPDEALGGVIFKDGVNTTLGASSPVSYKLYYNSTHVTDVVTGQLRGGDNRPREEQLQKLLQLPLPLQSAVEQAVVRLRSNSSSARLLPAVAALATPPYNTETKAESLNGFMPMYMILIFMLELGYIVATVLQEKEDKLKISLTIMGLPTSVYWCAHVVHSLLKQLPVLLFALVVCVLVLFPNSDALIVILLLVFFQIATIAFGLLMTVFFAKPSSGGGSVVFFLLLGLIGYVFNEATPAWLRQLGALAAPLAMFQAAHQLNWAEVTGGIQWSNISQPGIGRSQLPLGSLLGMIVLDILLYMLAAWYLDKVLPTQYGARLPPLFFLDKRYWTGDASGDGAAAAAAAAEDEHVDPLVMEPVSEDRKLSISLNKLKKVFQGDPPVKALRGLTLNMYEGQIYALLGHNGAGKSTCMGVLTGLYEKTSGSAFVNGLDVSLQLDQVRACVGICPQEDVLFKHLTCREHLEMAAGIKGLCRCPARLRRCHSHTACRTLPTGFPPAEAATMAAALAAELDIGEKLDCFAKDLSGGQKRKLTLAQAFVGNPRVLFLDEPTASMDPAARRKVWDLIASKKAGRTIVLTTHFMDEADMLGDRIGIMSAGRLQVEGSSIFLKKRFGLGYHLDFVKREDCEDSLPLRELITERLPGCRLDVEESSDLQFLAPLPSVDLFADLFEELDERREELGFVDYGVSMTTLEEVFVRLARQQEVVDPADVGVEEAKSKDSDGAASEEDEDAEHVVLEMAAVAKRQQSQRLLKADSALADSLPPVTELETLTVLEQVKAITLKRMLVLRRDRGTLTMNLVGPLLAVCLSMLFLSIGQIGASTTVEAVDMSSLADYDTQLWMPFVNGSLGSGLQASALAASLSHLSEPSVSTMAAGTSRDDAGLAALTAMDTLGMVAPLVNESAAAFAALDYKPDYWMTVNTTYYRAASAIMSLVHSGMQAVLLDLPQASASSFAMQLQPFPSTGSLAESLPQILASGLVAMYIVFGMSTLIRPQVSAAVREREIGMLHQQSVNGIQPLTYWLGTWLFEALFYLFPFLVVMVLLAILSGIHVALTTGDHFAATAILFLVWGWCIPPMSFAVSMLFDKQKTAEAYAQNVVNLPLTILLPLVLSLEALGAGGGIPGTIIGFFMPSVSLAKGLVDLAWPGRGFCYSEGCTIPSGLTYDIVGANCITMLCSAAFYMIVTLYMHRRKEVNRKHGLLPPEDEGVRPAEDRDVRRERERISGGEGGAIVMKNLRRVFPPSGSKDTKAKVAVSSVTLAAERGQLLGLLGPNGAGKTTAINMLTGLIEATDGTAEVIGHLMPTERAAAFKHMGVCPQHDALLPLLTGRENLRFYARIRGVKQKDMKGLIDWWISHVGLDEHADKPSGTYSGGNKRRLSLAVALVGNPDVVFLDEPTAGIDPVGRRGLWEIIKSYTPGHTIVLTTHLMEEADVLCQRIAIMVNGRLRALGSSQHLKSRFGNGFMLDVTLKEGAGMAAVTEKLSELEGDVLVREWHGQLVKYELATEDVRLSQLFRLLEDSKVELGISEYSVSQPTLEQVFVRFAREQRSEETK